MRYMNILYKDTYKNIVVKDKKKLIEITLITEPTLQISVTL